MTRKICTSSTGYLLGLFLLGMVAAGCGSTTENQSSNKTPPPGTPAVTTGAAPVPGLPTVNPPVSAPAPVVPAVVYPKGETLDEAAFAKLLKTPRAKFTVITVFAADCAPCIAESKHLATLVAAWKKRRINLIGISADITVERIDKFIKQVGGTQDYPMYIAPWFVENNKIDGTPVLFLFQPDGAALIKVSVDDTPEPLKALEAKLDEVQQGSPETTPGSENDPNVILQRWSEDQLDATEVRLPQLLPGLQRIAADAPIGGSSLEEVAVLEKRYRPELAQAGVAFGWAEKSWYVGPDLRTAVVKTDPALVPGLHPAEGTALPAARELTQVGGHANWSGTLSLWYDRSARKSFAILALVVQPDAAKAAELQKAGVAPEKLNTRLVLWFETEAVPERAQPMIANLPH